MVNLYSKSSTIKLLLIYSDAQLVKIVLFLQQMKKLKILTNGLLKENPEVAKEYVAKVQTYLKENADKIKELAGENAAIVSAVEAATKMQEYIIEIPLLADYQEVL